MDEATGRPYHGGRGASPTLSRIRTREKRGRNHDRPGPTDREEQPDDEVAPEVPTSFATKGVGWSGREEDDLEVIELDR